VNDVYKDFPSSSLALLDRLLAVEPDNRGTAASALEGEVSSAHITFIDLFVWLLYCLP